MRRHLILCLSLTVLAAGCTPNKSDAQPDDAKVAAKTDDAAKAATAEPENLADLTEEEQMQRLLGFGGFSTTKGQENPENQLGAARGGVKKNQNRQYRQYMNRRGGFNRPLEETGGSGF